ncbi:MAG: toprim domain-containing protein [Patescibacteria group bacterium]|nr:toprim domain-containing protein [Patescibacteria group bacterium]
MKLEWEKIQSFKEMRLPSPIEQFIAKLSELPSLGPRQATRLAFHLLRMGNISMKELGDAIHDMRTIQPCTHCFFPTQAPKSELSPHADNKDQNQKLRCHICKDPRRTPTIIMVVEKETDLISLEKSGKFNGHYFIIGEIPKTGILEEWQNLRLAHLKSLIQKELIPSAGSGHTEEIILGFNPTSVGDFSASLIARELKPFTKKISYLGRGLPTGGEIEFADDETLGSALERRS